MESVHRHQVPGQEFGIQGIYHPMELPKHQGITNLCLDSFFHYLVSLPIPGFYNLYPVYRGKRLKQQCSPLLFPHPIKERLHYPVFIFPTYSFSRRATASLAQAFRRLYHHVDVLFHSPAIG